MGLFDEAAREGAGQARAEKSAAEAEVRAEQERHRLNRERLPIVAEYGHEAATALQRAGVKPCRVWVPWTTTWSPVALWGIMSGWTLGFGGKRFFLKTSGRLLYIHTYHSTNPYIPIEKSFNPSYPGNRNTEPVYEYLGWHFDSSLSQWMVRWCPGDNVILTPLVEAIEDAVRRAGSSGL